MDYFRFGITLSWARHWLQWRRRAGRRSARQGSAVLATCFVVVFFAALPWADAAGRVAVVVVCEDYVQLQKSSVSAEQARAMAETLRAKGFDVLFEANATNARARAVLLDFSQKANGADVAIALLIGHTVAAGGQSYFLPVNTDLGVSTDLFSRGISIASVAQIAGKAKVAAVLVVMTTPKFETAVPGVDPRPEYTVENAKSVVTVFSSSSRSPVSRIDAAGVHAADSIVKLLQQPAPDLADLVNAAAADTGAVFGTPIAVSLAKPSATGAELKPGTGNRSGSQNPRSAAGTDPGAREPDGQADAAQLQLQKAKVELEKAKLETQRAQTEASRAEAEAAKAKAEAQTEIARARIESANASSPIDAAVAPVDEKQLGARQRRRIQESLRDLSLYTGPIDAIMGPLTREAIMGYQRSKGSKVTGYLTPEQFQALVPDKD
jgi:Putative peptidoglycan binding domain/Caspase domain